MGYQAGGTEPAGGGAVRRASDQRRVGGVGGGAEECAEHAFLFLGDRRLWVVRPEAGLAAISAGGGAVCRRTDGQADGHHAALCLVTAGLLAAWQNCRQSAFRCP